MTMAIRVVSDAGQADIRIDVLEHDEKQDNTANVQL